MQVCVQVYVVLWRLEKDTGFPGAGVSGSCELLDIDVGSCTGPLQEQQAHIINC